MPDLPHRKPARLPGHDYASPGAYFITICTHGRACTLGAIIDDRIVPSVLGGIVVGVWNALPSHFPGIALDAFVLMPNHLHGIVMIEEQPPAGGGIDPRETVGAKHASPLRAAAGKARGTTEGSLPAAVQAFKSSAAREINRVRGTPGAAVWQRGYFDHIIRTPDDLDRLRAYIESNPLRWALDQENPIHA